MYNNNNNFNRDNRIENNRDKKKKTRWVMYTR